MGQEMDHLNAFTFNIFLSRGTSSTLYGEQLSTAWGSIKLVHKRSQDLTHLLTTTVKTLGQRCDQANKGSADAEGTDFEVKKLVVSSRDKVQILKVALKQIKSPMILVEAGDHLAIPKVHMTVSDLMTLNVEEFDLDHFGKKPSYSTGHSPRINADQDSTVKD